MKKHIPLYVFLTTILIGYFAYIISSYRNVLMSLGMVTGISAKYFLKKRFK